MSEPWNPYASTTADLAIPAEESNEPAGRLTRLAAKLLDGVPIGGIAIVAAIGVASSLGGKTGEEAAAQWMSGFLGLWGFAMVAAALLWVVYTLRLMHTRGQTWGKKLLGIKVVRSDGSRLSLGRWIGLRVLVLGVIGSIPLLGAVVGIVDSLMIFGEKRRCLHDLIADSIVVQAR